MNIFKFPFSNLFLKNTHNRFLHSSGRDERKFYFCRMFLDFQKHFTIDLHFDCDHYQGNFEEKKLFIFNSTVLVFYHSISIFLHHL